MYYVMDMYSSKPQPVLNYAMDKCAAANCLLAIFWWYFVCFIQMFSKTFYLSIFVYITVENISVFKQQRYQFGTCSPAKLTPTSCVLSPEGLAVQLTYIPPVQWTLFHSGGENI